MLGYSVRLATVSTLLGMLFGASSETHAWGLALALCGLLSFSFVKNLGIIRGFPAEFTKPIVLKGDMGTDLATMDRYRGANFITTRTPGCFAVRWPRARRGRLWRRRPGVQRGNL